MKKIWIISITAVLIATLIAFSEMAGLKTIFLHNYSQDTKKSIDTVSFGQGRFKVTLPSEWQTNGNRAWHSTDKYQYINSGILGSESVRDDTAKELLSQGKIKEFETYATAILCKESGSCGKISDFQSIGSQDGIDRFEFFVTYPGTSVDKPDGFTTEIHHSIFSDGTLYRFWTSTTEISGKQSGTISNFRNIMNTLTIEERGIQK